MKSRYLKFLVLILSSIATSHASESKRTIYFDCDPALIDSKSSDYISVKSKNPGESLSVKYNDEDGKCILHITKSEKKLSGAQNPVDIREGNVDALLLGLFIMGCNYEKEFSPDNLTNVPSEEILSKFKPLPTNYQRRGPHRVNVVVYGDYMLHPSQTFFDNCLLVAHKEHQASVSTCQTFDETSLHLKKNKFFDIKPVEDFNKIVLESARTGGCFTSAKEEEEMKILDTKRLKKAREAYKNPGLYPINIIRIKSHSDNTDKKIHFQGIFDFKNDYMKALIQGGTVDFFTTEYYEFKPLR